MEILAITVPIFIFVAMGYILKQKNIISVDTRTFLSKLVYYFAFPLLVFRSIVSFDFASTFRLNLVAHNITVTCIVFIITFAAAFLIRDRRKRGAFHMSCFRTNQGYMGLPVVNGFYGDAAMSRAAVVNGFDSPVVIILSVLALEVFRGKNPPNRTSDSKSPVGIIGEKLKAFIANPFILSSVLGLALSYFKVPVLKISIVDQFLSIAGGMALPLALISIGCSIEAVHLKKNIKLVLQAASVKLLAMPAIAFVLAWFVFNFRGVDLGMSVILTAMPSSVSSYVMALEMGADEELSAAIIGITTLGSVVTISLIQYLLKLHFI
ncbi:MAG: hypothetical protein A2Y21_10085 [Clostridiales bacterium GWC2_40_7]|nr:MAG: hypothetical protein A2Y21_10085 [Clostridiales bacterium GWC2_40_7]